MANMNRKEWLIKTGMASGALLFSPIINSFPLPLGIKSDGFTREDFGNDFKWGVAAAAYQTEGAWNIDGKSESNWDHFSRKSGKIERGENADIATDFYH